MQAFLETDRMVLRRFTAADVDNLVDLDGDPAVMRLLTGGRPTPREVIENEVLPSLLLPDSGRWAAVEKPSGEFLGWFALARPAGGSGDEAELGYRLRASAWGKGYATEGSLALIRKGFTELGMRRVYAQTMAVNVASRRVMEKAGMRHARTLHLTWDDPIDGSEHGEVEYELTRQEWEQARCHIAKWEGSARALKDEQGAGGDCDGGVGRDDPRAVRDRGVRLAGHRVHHERPLGAVGHAGQPHLQVVIVGVEAQQERGVGDALAAAVEVADRLAVEEHGDVLAEAGAPVLHGHLGGVLPEPRDVG